MIRAGLVSAAAAVDTIAERDPSLPDLPVLLDPRRLAETLGSPLTVERVRYKRGSSIVVAVRYESGERAWVVSYSDPEKLSKNELRAREAGLEATLLGARSLSGPAAADRVLSRHLARLDRARPGLLDDERVVRYNPHRRLVVRAGGQAVKISAQPPSIGDRAARALAGAGLPVLAPTTIGDHVSTTPWWGSSDLSVRADPALEHEAGRVLAALHAGDRAVTDGVPRLSTVSTASAAAAAVSTVLPALSGRVARLTTRVVDILGSVEPDALLHGDWSLDQVLTERDQVRLIDFDRITVGPAGRDLGSARAAGASDAMIEGYLNAGGALDPRTLPAWTALSLLQRAIDPFRELHADWPTDVARAVELAEEMVS